MDWLIQLDGAILLLIQEIIRNDILTPIMIFITSLGDAGFIWILLLILLLFLPKYRKVGITGLIALALGFLITNVILKTNVARIRPYEILEGLEYLGKMPHDYSFPSGHATCSIAAGVVLLKKMPRKFGIPCMVLAVLICLSRLYVGVHYPSDVLGGVLVGFIGAVAAIALMDFSKQNQNK